MQEILRARFAVYAKRRRLPLHVHKAAAAMMACRTVALGGHAKVCEDGHVNGVWYNSCRHRSCPQCNWRQIDGWLEGKKEVLLPVEHRQVVFTLPHELLPLWRYNRESMADLLFRCARDTLMELVEDPKYAGGKPGLIIALQSWSESLVLHPHLHCLVTAGGWSEDGEWRPAKRRKIFLPAAVVRLLFEGKFKRRLERLIEQGELRLPASLTRQKARKLLVRASSKPWNVFIGERYSHGWGLPPTSVVTCGVVR